MKKLYTLSLILSSVVLTSSAQQKQDSTTKNNARVGAYIDSAKQRDLIDVIVKLFHISSSGDQRQEAKKISLSVVPSVSYSLTTGFQADLTGNAGFYTTSDHHENYSEITGDLTYDTKDQKISVFRSEVWFGDNQYKLVTDTRWERFPEDTYGLGTTSTVAKANHLDFKYVRSYFTIYKKIGTDLYAGAGYDLDYHYGISQGGNADSTLSDYSRYGFRPASISSGINVSLLFDNRRNPINPINGGYVSIIYRDNPIFMGSDNSWQSLQFDLRRYIRLSESNNNILALWGLFWFTHGNVPYLDLPGTAEDMFNNSGRGYIQGRFTGRNMLYVESEYRFGITSNGLLGAVVFANAESVSEYPSNDFSKIAPALGTGLRVKMNKHSNTNICIDYAVGINKSNGIFLNLGEIF
ncbi:MAG: BamA/TamA family outer membrane protein [Bacteroidetes bacterium]|nr:BamA/TamA family outer membrane protein [Bacteroidota bacterium]